MFNKNQSTGAPTKSAAKTNLRENPIQFIQDFHALKAKSSLEQLTADVNNEKENLLKKEVEMIFADDQKDDTMPLAPNYNFEGIPNITHVSDKDALLSYHQKLVRFDCIVTDMYEPEYFVSVINASTQNAPPLVYKYFQQLTTSQNDLYGDNIPECTATNTLERGIILANSVPQTTAWTVDASLGSVTPMEFQVSYPPQKAVLKTYDQDLESLKLLDTISVVGILEYSPPSPQQDSQMTDLGAGEDFPKGPCDVDNMPQIHVLLHDSNYVISTQPQLNSKKITKDLSGLDKDHIDQAGQKIMAVLTNILHGDKLAAKYLLISLLSRVNSRDTGMNIGNIPLNLSNMTPEQATALTDFLFQICPLFGSFDLTTESLSKSVFQPKGSSDGNGLEESVLGQMAANSVLLLDESNMVTGKIDGQGLDNIKAIATLIEQQQIEFNYQFYQTNLPINVATVICGSGRSIFKNSLHLPLNPEKKFDKKKYMEVLQCKETLDQMRTLMLLGAILYQQNKAAAQIRDDQFEIGPQVAEHIQKIFVETRQVEAQEKNSQSNDEEEQSQEQLQFKTTEDTMHRWLSLSRYLCLMRGCTNLTIEIFDEAVQLENGRLARHKAAMQKQPQGAAKAAAMKPDESQETNKVQIPAQNLAEES